jgi:Ran GTPase-activating protein (RanGAP) involved in mRNA processing and transport
MSRTLQEAFTSARAEAALSKEPASIDISSLEISDEDFRDVVLPALKDWPVPVCQLSMDDNALTCESVTALERIFNQQTQVGFRLAELQRLSLRQNQLEEGGAKSLARILRRSSIKSLSIGSNAIGASGFRAISNTLIEHAAVSTLRELRLDDCDLEADVGASLNALLLSHPLERLILEGNDLGDVGASAIAQSLSQNSRLQALSLTACDIGEVGMRSIGAALEINSSLRVLELSQNPGGDSGAQSILKALETNGALQDLRLDGNDICDLNESITKAVARNRCLKRLRLRDNKIGDGVLVLFCRDLCENSSLVDLDLAGNMIEGGNIREVLRALDRNQTLEYVDIRSNPLGPEAEEALAERQAKSLSLVANGWIDKKKEVQNRLTIEYRAIDHATDESYCSWHST